MNHREPDLEALRARLRLAAVPGVPEIRLHQQHPGSGLGRLLGDAGPAPYWARPWAGGAVLARCVLDRAALVRGRRVVDLGTGSGLVAIAAARAGASAVVAVDVDPIAIAAARLNAAANDVALVFHLADILDGPAPDADLVLAGDVFYEAALARRVAAFLDRCAAAGVPAWIGDPGRRHLPHDRLRRIFDHPVPDFGGNAPVPAAVFAFVPAGG